MTTETSFAQSILPMLYTCVSKPGTFELIGNAQGQGEGPIRALMVTVYRNTETGELLFRTPQDFATRMQPVPLN